MFASNVVPRLASPFCAIHGEKDYAVPIASLEYLNKHAKTPMEDRSLHCLEGAYHDVLGDPSAEEAVYLMTSFMEDRIVRMKRKSLESKTASGATGQELLKLSRCSSESTVVETFDGLSAEDSIGDESGDRFEPIPAVVEETISSIHGRHTPKVKIT